MFNIKTCSGTYAPDWSMTSALLSFPHRTIVRGKDKGVGSGVGLISLNNKCAFMQEVIYRSGDKWCGGCGFCIIDDNTWDTTNQWQKPGMVF